MLTTTPKTLWAKLKTPISSRTVSLLIWLAISCTLWGLVIEPELIVQRDRTVQLPTWPKACDGVKILLVSDLHMGDIHSHSRRMAYLAYKMKRTHPDIIVIAGDFIAHVSLGRTLPLEEIAPKLAGWKDIAPTYAVLGNHDLYDLDQPPEQSIKFLRDQGVHALSNERASVSLRNSACQFELAGIGDGFTGQDRVETTFSGVRPGSPVLALTHDPRVQLKVSDQQAQVLMAGHTHGGVFCVPGTLWCASRLSGWTGGYTRGWYETPGHPVTLVSSGINNSILPMRFGAVPGFDVVTVHVGGPAK